MNHTLSRIASDRGPAGALVDRRIARVARTIGRGLIRGALLWLVAGCVAQPLPVSVRTITAYPNPSADGAYTVSWAPIAGASRYRLRENGIEIYEGSNPSHRVVGKAAGTYAYSLSYCVTVFGIEACNLKPAVENVTVEVTDH